MANTDPLRITNSALEEVEARIDRLTKSISYEQNQVADLKNQIAGHEDNIAHHERRISEWRDILAKVTH